MVPATEAPIHSVVGSTAPIGPEADRSGVVNASMILKARVSSHSPADQTPIMAAFQTSATAAEAASPSQLIGLRSIIGSRPPPASGSAMTQIPVTDAEREIGVRPHRRRLCRFVARPDHPAVCVPHHALAIGGRAAGGLLQGHVELEVHAGHDEVRPDAALDLAHERCQDDGELRGPPPDRPVAFSSARIARTPDQLVVVGPPGNAQAAITARAPDSEPDCSAVWSMAASCAIAPSGVCGKPVGTPPGPVTVAGGSTIGGPGSRSETGAGRAAGSRTARIGLGGRAALASAGGPWAGPSGPPPPAPRRPPALPALVWRPVRPGRRGVPVGGSCRPPPPSRRRS